MIPSLILDRTLAESKLQMILQQLLSGVYPRILPRPPFVQGLAA